MICLRRSVATVATLICLAAQLTRALYLTQDSYAPCSYMPDAPVKMLDCSSRDLTDVPGIDPAMTVNAFYLDGNAIVNIGPNAFANLSRSLTLLSVKSSALMDRIDNAAFTGLSALTMLVVQGKKDSEKSMNKVSLAQLLNGLRSLSSLIFNNINVNELPPGFASGTSLVNLTLAEAAITTITPDAFYNASSLRALNLSYNTFGATAGSMSWLRWATSLETGVFIGSQITKEYLGQVPSLLRLKKLDFTNNGLTRLEANSLSNVGASLEELQLSNNPISEANTAGLAALSALKRLTMTQNTQLKAIPPEVKQLQALELLDLRGTQVGGVEADSFPPTNSRLRSLKLDFTNVHSLHALAFAKLTTTLEDFTLSTSGLSTAVIVNTAGVQQAPGNWSVILAQVPRLQNLTLSGTGNDDASSGGLTNSIWGAVKQLPSLRRLALEFNKITSVPDFYFADFANLTYVSLKGNAINRVTSGALYGTGGAQILLTSNSLSAIDNCTFAMFRNLSGVSLDGNPFTCSCALQWLWRRVRSDSPQSLAAMSCFLPAALAGKTWDTVTESSFCSPGETPASNCSVLVPSTAPPPTTASLLYLLNITVSKTGESSVSLEASVGQLVKQFTGYTVKYWPVTRPEAVLNVSLRPMTMGSITLQIRANEQYRFCYVLLNGSASPIESPANCRDFTLSGLASAAVIAIGVLAAIIGTALVFAAVCLLCKRLRHGQQAAKHQTVEEDPYTYTYPDDKQIGKSNNHGSSSQFQPTLRPESKRYSKRSRNNLAGSRPSLATSTTTLATCRMSSPGGFAVQNGARPSSGGLVTQHQQRPGMLSGAGFVQPSQSMHSIAETGGGRRFVDPGFQQRQLMSRSQDQLSESPGVAPPAHRSGREQLPPPPRHAQSQELVLDVTRAAGAGSARYLHQQPPLPPPPPRSHRVPSQPPALIQTQRHPHHQPLEHGEGGYVPMSSSADYLGDPGSLGGLGESSTDDPRQYQHQQPPESQIPIYNPYLTDEQFEEATSPQQPLPPPQVHIVAPGNGGVDNSAFQRNDTSGYYEMGQF